MWPPTQSEDPKSSGHPRKEKPSITASGKRIGRPPAETSKFSFKYTLRDEDNVNVSVCQKGFCHVLGFGPKRIQVLRRKLNAGEVQPDQRGKHGNHQSVGEDTRDKIRAHILSYPTRHSHYSRKDNSHKVYLSPELSITRLHRAFLEQYDPEYLQLEEENRKLRIAHKPIKKLRKPFVTEHLYHDIFVSEFNIHFGYPRTDTCSTCDRLSVTIDVTPPGEERTLLEKELSKHQQLSQNGYDSLRYDRQLSRSSWEKQVQSN